VQRDFEQAKQKYFNKNKEEAKINKTIAKESKLQLNINAK
jgi:hypothetical protein